MIPWIELDSAAIPGEAATLRLKQRGAEFSIMLGSNELMNSRLYGSEEALAELAAERIAGRKAPAVLIGGLGMGFTLRAALAVLPADARIVVAELVPAVVAWARGQMADVFKGALDDPRVEVVTGDVTALIARSKGAFDAILLDVDNGPDGLTRSSNDRLYSLSGLAAAKSALKKAGVLAVWSAHPDDRFTARMKKSGFATEAVSVRANAKKRGARHVVWLGMN
ncbi:UNVERIFIED_ORG: spermine/spermidine synthase [Martelella mediterranea]